MVCLTFAIDNMCYSQSNKLLSVKIECEGFFTETIINVDCNSFRQQFKETMKVKVIKDRNEVADFNSLVQMLKKKETPKNIDIRGILTLNYSKKKLQYCFDTFGMFYKDGKAYQDIKLLTHISDKLYSNHPKYLDSLSSGKRNAVNYNQFNSTRWGSSQQVNNYIF